LFVATPLVGISPRSPAPLITVCSAWKRATPLASAPSMGEPDLLGG
jgi:hypothetical protein